MRGMKQLLLIFAVVTSVGCASTSICPEQSAIIEAAIRSSLKKPTRELTKADLWKVETLFLVGTQIADTSLKEVTEHWRGMIREIDASRT